MNCMEFQRELNADPRRLSAAALGHAEGCSDCARRMVRQINLDAQWEAELQAPSPVGMEDRILLATKIGQRKRQRVYALAATLVFGVALAFSLSLTRHGDDGVRDLAAQAGQHVLDEPDHLRETVLVAPGMLNELLARVGARAQGSLPVTYANPCKMPNGEGGHIVLSTPYGRVTLLLDPNVKTDAMLRRSSDSLIVEVHAARRGSYSLVAPSEAAMSEAKAILARQLQWV